MDASKTGNELSENNYMSPFEWHENSKTIACVGENGGTYDEWIREGFSKTVGLIYSQIKKNHDEDIYIYPLFYCARHSVELGLKVSIKTILEIYHLKKCKVPDAAKTSLTSHNITDLSAILKALTVIDDRFFAAYSKATAYLADYQVDPESDLFRYTNAVNGTPNLAAANIGSVDVDLLYYHFCNTTEGFSEFIAISEDLLDEYRQGTYTRELSRKQLEEIAHLLPSRNQWGTPLFDAQKDLIIQKYNLPSRSAFSRAVDTIKSHREFCSIIGDEQRVPYLDEDAIRVYRSCVDYLSFSNTAGRNDDIKERLSEIQKETRELRKLSQKLTYEQIAVFLTLLDIGKGNAYSERFDAILDYMISSNFDRMWAIRKITHNPNYIATGLKKCGQPCFLRMLMRNTLSLEEV